MPASSQVNPSLIFSLRRVTESAATAAFSWIGRGDSQDAGTAALDVFSEWKSVYVDFSGKLQRAQIDA